jgi:hypothetical protein
MDFGSETSLLSCPIMSSLGRTVIDISVFSTRSDSDITDITYSPGSSNCNPPKSTYPF